MTTVTTGRDIEIRAAMRPEWDAILTPEALRFVAALQREFNPRREELLRRREERKKRLDAGEMPDFLAQTRDVREADWTVAPIPGDQRSSRLASISSSELGSQALTRTPIHVCWQGWLLQSFSCDTR